MSLRSLVSIVLVAAVITLASSGSAHAYDEAPAGADDTAIAANLAASGYVPDMNWVGENPDGDGPPAIFMFINFAAFAVLIIALGRKPLLRHLETRHTLIKDALQEAAKIRAAAKAQLDEYGQRIADVDSEVEQLIADVRADAAAEKERIIEEGRQQAERLKRDAADRIDAEFVRARREIEQEVVAAAVAAAERILRKSASPKDKSALVDAFIADIQRAESDSPTSPRGAS
jgi:F-type H+-transporting ATPase subunit b